MWVNPKGKSEVESEDICNISIQINKKNPASLSTLSIALVPPFWFSDMEVESALQEHLKGRDCLCKEESSKATIPKAFSMYIIYIALAKKFAWVFP